MMTLKYVQLYEQCYNAINEAIVRVQNQNNVSGDCSPQLSDRFDEARQIFIDVLMEQIIENKR